MGTQSVQPLDSTIYSDPRAGQSLSLIQRGDTAETRTALIKAPLRIYKAAFMMASGEPISKIASRLTISEQGVRRWMRTHPVVFSRANERFAKEVLERGLMDKGLRLRKLAKHQQLIENIVDESKYKSSKTIIQGESAPVKVEEFDARLAKEYRETLEQFAKEAGDAYSRATGPTINVQTSVIATSDTKSVLQVLTRNEDSVDV